MIYPFAEYQPDLPAFMSGAMRNTRNTIPQRGGYAPFRELSTNTSALTAYPRGAISVFDTSQNATSFAGDATKLYKLTGTTWSDVTNAGGAYTLASTERWEFAQFGNQIIAVSAGENPQEYTQGSSSKFADLSGTPPTASTVGVVGNFVMLGNTADGSNYVEWSAIDDATGWTPGTNQAGQQEIPYGGAVQRVVSGEIGYIFMDSAIVRATYVGTPLVFQFDQVHVNRGIKAPGGVIRIGNVIYFLATDGFYALEVYSGQIARIGHGKVDADFFNNLDSDGARRISTAYDLESRVVFWGYPSTASDSDSTPDSILAYHWPSGRWSPIEQDHELIFSALTSGTTLEDLDAQQSFIDLLEVSLDHPQWKGGNRVMAGFDTSNKMGFFSGDTLEAVFETGEFEGPQGFRSYINSVRPLVDASTITGFVRSKTRLSDSLSDSASGSVNSNGEIPLQAEGRYHRVQITVAGGQTWKFAQGVQLNPIPSGEQ